MKSGINEFLNSPPKLRFTATALLNDFRSPLISTDLGHRVNERILNFVEPFLIAELNLKDSLKFLRNLKISPLEVFEVNGETTEQPVKLSR